MFAVESGGVLTRSTQILSQVRLAEEYRCSVRAGARPLIIAAQPPSLIRRGRPLNLRSPRELPARIAPTPPPSLQTASNASDTVFLPRILAERTSECVRVAFLVPALSREEITGRRSAVLERERPNGWNHRPRAPSSGTPALSKN